MSKETRMKELLETGKSFDEALAIINKEAKEEKEHLIAKRKQYVRENAKYVCKTTSFEKNGKVNPVFQIWKHVDGVATRPLPEFAFGLSKAKLVIQQMNEIKKFVANHK